MTDIENKIREAWNAAEKEWREGGHGLPHLTPGSRRADRGEGCGDCEQLKIGKGLCEEMRDAAVATAQENYAKLTAAHEREEKAVKALKNIAFRSLYGNGVAQYEMRNVAQEALADYDASRAEKKSRE